MRGRSTAPAAETPPPRRRGHAAWAWHNKAGAWPGPTSTTGLERVPAAAEAPPGRDRRFGGGGGGERERAALPPRAWGTGDFNGSPAPRPRSRGQRQEAGRLTAGSRLGPVRAGAVPFAERRRGRCAAEQRDAALLPLPR